jgi:chemotaxis protein CheZ
MITNDELVQELMAKVTEQVTESLKGSLQKAIEKEISRNLSKALLEGEFYRRINQDLQGGLKAIYKEITDARKGQDPAGVAVSGNPDELFSEASDQLDKILQTTEKATVEIMDIVENLQAMQMTLGDIVKGLETGGVSKENRVRLAEINAGLGEDLMRIMTTLGFQDLTGQRIKRIVTAIKQVEKIVLDLYMSTGLIIKAREEEPEKDLEQLKQMSQVKMSELKGPVMGVKQNDVDDLLGSLGL